MACLLLFLVAACGRSDVKVYTVPKEQAPAEVQANPTPAAAPVAMPLKWTLPEGWKESPPGEMRAASFRVTRNGKSADVSVVPLPGQAGGDFSNVNRWRGQVGLSPVTPEELAKLAQPVELAGRPAFLYEQTGETAGDPATILAVVQHRDDTTWFFKMTGDSQLVSQEKPAFVSFLKTFQIPTAETPAALPEGHPNIGTLPVVNEAPAASSEGKPNWQVPSGWKEVAGGQFLIAKFVIAGDGGSQAAVNISSSAGNGGGLSANINRWRKQLGLGDLPPAELAKSTKSLQSAAGPITFVEMTGTDARSQQAAAMIGAIVLQPGKAWFYKLMGDPAVVAAQKDAFEKFVQEAKY